MDFQIGSEFWLQRWWDGSANSICHSIYDLKLNVAPHMILVGSDLWGEVRGMSVLTGLPQYILIGFSFSANGVVRSYALFSKV